MKEITLNATSDKTPEVTAFIDCELESVDCPMKAQMQIDMAIDEIFSNICLYAYKPDIGPATVRFEFSEADGLVTLTFIDRGKPYNPLAKADPDVTLPAEQRAIGGLGIFLVKRTMDTLDYRYENGQNIFSFGKYIRAKK